MAIYSGIQILMLYNTKNAYKTVTSLKQLPADWVGEALLRSKKYTSYTRQ